MNYIKKKLLYELYLVGGFVVNILYVTEIYPIVNFLWIGFSKYVTCYFKYVIYTFINIIFYVSGISNVPS